MSHEKSILFTAFEPSGDDHASVVIEELKRRQPGLSIHAWGGPKMARAGADLVERTGDDAVMGLPGLAKIREHKRINARIEAWLSKHRPAVHVPVDSPAANFPVCALSKASGAKVVHLVAPQVWAWAEWRVKKLRRLTDHVCCLLPFEEPWFRQRRVPATFVGHPLFDRRLDTKVLDAASAGWPDNGGPRIALLPGSRPSEIKRNFATLIEAYRAIERDHPGTRGVIAASRPDLEPELRAIARGAGLGWPETLVVVEGQTDAVVRWCELAVVVSGTVTLQIARQAKPMVIVYKSSRLLYEALGRWLIKTPYFTLPNLLAGREIVPEFVPHFGSAAQVVERARGLVRTEAATKQAEALDTIAGRFHGHHAARETADIIERALANDLPPLPGLTRS